MTLAAQIRLDVLQYAEQGLPEEEIATLAGTTLQRVQRLLEAAEAPPRPEPPERTPPARHARTITAPTPARAPRPRQDPKPAQAKPPVKVKAPPREKPPPKPPRVPKHGTESGYTSLHQRPKIPPCEPCRLALNAGQARRRLAKGHAQRRANEQAAVRYHRWATDTMPIRVRSQVMRDTLLP